MKLDGPDKNIFEVNDEFSISFRMESEFVEKFVDLTGDKSSLHTDHLFARKSIFRQKVVHGMLPVMFVSALPPCYNGPSKTAIQMGGESTLSLCSQSQYPPHLCTISFK